jgi:hypothetical protein
VQRIVLVILLICTAFLSHRPARAHEASAVIANALEAAPASIAERATVLDWSGTVLREGTNGWVCFPDPPDVEAAPMCLDGPWQSWATSWQRHEPLTIRQVGIAYMLLGDAGASNVDPHAEGRTADNEWVQTGPHLMLLVPDPAALEGIPTNPKNGGPWVMWKGTPYAHVMIPVPGNR